MRIILLVAIVLSSTSSFSQETPLNEESSIVKSTNQHHFELSPASIWFNKGFFIGHRFRYNFSINRNMNIDLATDGTVFRILDRRSKKLQEAKVFPRLNQTTAAFSKNLYGVGKVINRNKQKRFALSVRFGYHFFQHATPYDEREYWAYDSTAQMGISSIRSFQSHSALLGFGFETQKIKRFDGHMRQVSSHQWSLDYLGCFYYQLTSYSLNDQKDYDIKNIENQYGLDRNGMRLHYNYVRYLNKNFGIHAGVEALYVPFLKNYQPLPEGYYVPRGGEGIAPFFTNVKIGVTYRL